MKILTTKIHFELLTHKLSSPIQHQFRINSKKLFITRFWLRETLQIQRLKLQFSFYINLTQNGGNF